ncbi:MAG: sensor domain-containing diguanylate cyclase [Syntrophales bacterium]
MNQALKRICHRAVNALGISYQLARGVDYKTLSQHILSIHQLKDIDSILYRSSRCLKEILDYDLFAFAMVDQAAVDVWIDPKFQFNNAAILNIIKSDLAMTDGACTVHHFDDDSPRSGNILALELKNLLSYRVADADFTARLYILPNRNVMPYHHDIVETILKVVGTSLSHCMCIKRLQDTVVIDPLTLCYNRRALDGFIDHAIASTRRYGSDLSAVMFDLDNFKKINDTFGHQAGDDVLKTVSRTILSTIRKCDYLVRYGGDEFVLIMPETKLGRAVDVADRLRKIIENLAIQSGGTCLRVTASCGVAHLKTDYDKNLLLQDADRRLYDAKTRGRNRTMPDMRLLSFETSSIPDSAYQYLN